MPGIAMKRGICFIRSIQQDVRVGADRDATLSRHRRVGEAGDVADGRMVSEGAYVLRTNVTDWAGHYVLIN
jgi:hypothetical protein